MNPQVVERKMYAAMSTLGTAIEQAEKQQPVAWMYVNTDGECEQIEYGLCDFDDPSIQLLYTAPRQWVGLTAKDLAEIPPSAYEGAIWADAKLKEKNT
jgi:hypothetical protein